MSLSASGVDVVILRDRSGVHILNKHYDSKKNAHYCKNERLFLWIILVWKQECTKHWKIHLQFILFFKQQLALFRKRKEKHNYGSCHPMQL